MIHYYDVIGNIFESLFTEIVQLIYEFCFKMAAGVSRFGVLKIEGDSDEEKTLVSFDFSNSVFEKVTRLNGGHNNEF